VTSFSEGLVRGFLHEPESANGNGLVITHGAGGNCQAALLVTAADAFTKAGFWVLRCDLPFRQARQYGPPMRGTAKQDQNGLREAAAAMRRICGGKVVLSGHSYGGRQATMLLAENPTQADLLLLFSYPLHPPKKPEQTRTEHFPSLKTNSIFVHGTRDPFGSLDEMNAALRLIPAKKELVAVEGAGHDLKSGKFDWQAIAIDRVAAAFS
jgi:uncharacterized protein